MPLRNAADRLESGYRFYAQSHMHFGGIPTDKVTLNEWVYALANKSAERYLIAHASFNKSFPMVSNGFQRPEYLSIFTPRSRVIGGDVFLVPQVDYLRGRVQFSCNLNASLHILCSDHLVSDWHALLESFHINRSALSPEALIEDDGKNRRSSKGHLHSLLNRSTLDPTARSFVLSLYAEDIELYNLACRRTTPGRERGGSSHGSSSLTLG